MNKSKNKLRSKKMFSFLKSMWRWNLTLNSKASELDRPDWFEGESKRNQFVPVPKHTHAPKGSGRDVYCPKCNRTEHVKEMTCEGCETTTTKYEWLLKK